jgi:hypothetical protein
MIKLTAEQTAAVVTMATLQQSCTDAAIAAAAGNLVATHSATGSRMRISGAPHMVAVAIRNVLIDVQKAGLVTDENRPAFRQCVEVADQLDQLALDHPVGTA